MRHACAAPQFPPAATLRVGGVPAMPVPYAPAKGNPEAIRRPGVLAGIAVQSGAIHSLVDDLERRLGRVLTPKLEPDCGDTPIDETRVPRDPDDYHGRDLELGLNRAANRLSALIDRIDL